MNIISKALHNRIIAVLAGVMLCVYAAPLGGLFADLHDEPVADMEEIFTNAVSETSPATGVEITYKALGEGFVGLQSFYDDSDYRGCAIIPTDENIFIGWVTEQGEYLTDHEVYVPLSMSEDITAYAVFIPREEYTGETEEMRETAVSKVLVETDQIDLDSDIDHKSDMDDITDDGSGLESDADDITGEGSGSELDTDSIIDDGSGSESDADDITGKGFGLEYDADDIADEGSGSKSDADDIVDEGSGSKSDADDITDQESASGSKKEPESIPDSEMVSGPKYDIGSDITNEIPEENQTEDKSEQPVSDLSASDINNSEGNNLLTGGMEIIIDNYGADISSEDQLEETKTSVSDDPATAEGGLSGQTTVNKEDLSLNNTDENYYPQTVDSNDSRSDEKDYQDTDQTASPDIPEIETKYGITEFTKKAEHKLDLPDDVIQLDYTDLSDDTSENNKAKSDKVYNALCVDSDTNKVLSSTDDVPAISGQKVTLKDSITDDYKLDSIGVYYHVESDKYEKEPLEFYAGSDDVIECNTDSLSASVIDEPKDNISVVYYLSDNVQVPLSGMLLAANSQITRPADNGVDIDGLPFILAAVFSGISGLFCYCSRKWLEKNQNR